MFTTAYFGVCNVTLDLRCFWTHTHTGSGATSQLCGPSGSSSGLTIWCYPKSTVFCRPALWAGRRGRLATRAARLRGVARHARFFCPFGASAFRQTKPSAKTRAVSRKKKKVNQLRFPLSKSTLFAQVVSGASDRLYGRDGRGRLATVRPKRAFMS